jgi:hypothetical protein
MGTWLWFFDGGLIMEKKEQRDFVLVRIATNEQGVILVLALLVMVVLTIMGIAAMSIRNTGQSVTANAEVFQHNFYAVESVTLEGAAEIEKMSDTILNDPSSYPAWLKLESAGVDLEQSSQWPSGLITPAETLLRSNTATKITPDGYVSNGTAAGDRVMYAAIDHGISSGGSLTYGSGGTTAQERIFDVYGMYDIKQGAGKSYHGKMMLAVGYKKVVYSE